MIADPLRAPPQPQTRPSAPPNGPTNLSDAAPPLELQPLHRRADARGALLKVLPHAVAGEVYAVELRPGLPRGEHLHRAAGEWFCALSGAAWLLARAPATGDEALVRLDGSQRARVPAGVAHALWAADGQPALVLAGADRAHPFEQTEPFPLLAGRAWPDLPAVDR